MRYDMHLTISSTCSVFEPKSHKKSPKPRHLNHFSSRTNLDKALELEISLRAPLISHHALLVRRDHLACS